MMQVDTQHNLSDIQKNIILRYHSDPLSPGILEDTKCCQNLVEELNRSSQKNLDHSFWSSCIKRWKKTVVNQYFYTKKMQRNVFSIQDLQLLLHMKDSLDDAAEELINPDNVVTCRICLTDVHKQDTCNLFTTSVDDNYSLDVFLNTFTIVFAVRQDGLPEEICLSCLKNLQMLHNFRQMCEKNDQQLRQNAAVVEKFDVIPELEDIAFDSDRETVSCYKDDHGDSIYDRDAYDSSATTESAKSEENLKYRCHLCKSFYNNPGSLYRHFHNSCWARRKCDKCGKIYASSTSLWIHMNKHKYEHKRKEIYDCHFCARKFPTKERITEHLETHKKRTQNTGSAFMCEICGKKSTTLHNLKNHMKTHLVEKQYACSLCPYRTNDSHALKIHERSHTGDKPYPCDLCNSSFKTASNRLKHVRNVHKKLKPYKCSMCDRSFTTANMVEKHCVTHTGAKPYQCPVCMQLFGWYHCLRKHMIKQHKEIYRSRKNYLEIFNTQKK